jgi:membrane protease YdiL (CAAX protease family)
MLISIALVAVPLLVFHLSRSRKEEGKPSVFDLNGFSNKLSNGKLIGYSLGLVILAFLIWGITQPMNTLITNQLLQWLPNWFTTQDFSGYEEDKIKITLILNLLLNGFLAPFVEELYYRGYLLPRMGNWGKYAFVANAVLFSLYHFWQPYIYITLILALLPMTYVVWKTKDLRVGILTHCLLNLIGAVLTFAMISKP